MLHARRSTKLLVSALLVGLLAACSTTGSSKDSDDDQSPSSTLPADPDSGLAAANEGDTIQVGVPYTGDGEEANANVGAGAITRNDEAAAARAVIDDINAAGGVAGKQLEPVFFAYSATSAQTRSSQDQAACAAFTEDANIAVLLGSGLTRSFDECMLKAGVLVLNSGTLIGPDEKRFADFPNVYDVGVVSQERMLADEADTLERLDYFSGWDPAAGKPADGETTLAVLSVDQPEWDGPVHDVLLPALDGLGHPVADNLVFPIPPAATEAELGEASKALQNALLRMVDSGVTHVIVLDASGTVTLLFAQAAAQQKFYPRLGINSATGAQALHDAGVLPAEQLAGAVGLGWQPTLDLPASEGDVHATAATTECLDVVKTATGQEFTSTNAAGLAMSKCDMGHLMAAALDAIDGDLSLDAAAAAIAELGDGYQSALLPGSGFTGARHDAVQVGYDMAWDDECGCVAYQAEHAIP